MDEYPARVPYLDVAPVATRFPCVARLGSDTAHYTASKIFPYILARKHILAIYRTESSVVDIVRKTRKHVSCELSLALLQNKVK